MPGEGKVTIDYTISLEGYVSQVKIKESSLNNLQAETCMMHVISKIQFAAPKGGVVHVVYPFSFLDVHLKQL